MRFTLRRDDGSHRWPGYLFGRMRTSTVVLLIAFFATWWVYYTYRPEPAPEPPATQVVPPGFVPDPQYTWVPRTKVAVPTITTTTTTTPTETTETTPPESDVTDTTGPEAPTPGQTTVTTTPGAPGAPGAPTETTTSDPNPLLPAPAPPTTTAGSGPGPAPTTSPRAQ